MNEKFLKNLKELVGEEDFIKYLNSMKIPPVKSFRINKTKIADNEMYNSDTKSHNVIKSILNGYIIKKNPIIDTAFQIDNEEKLGNLWFHKAGLIYMQEPSSMMAVETLKRANNFLGARVLDACAAPGGKTSQLSEMVGENGFVLSNEKNIKRANILRSNVERLGLKNVAISSCDTSVLNENLSGEFDAVLVDAPCSGEGMFRKDFNAQNEWSENEVVRNSNLQLQILNNCACCVKKGGYLVYSTCTFNTTENEQVILNFLKQNSNFKIIEVDKVIQKVSSSGVVLDNCESLKYARRFYPFHNFGEGQFICLMKNMQTCDNDFSCLKPTISSKQNLKKVESFLIENVQIKNFNVTELGSTYFLYNKNFPNLKNIPLLTCGVAVCEIDNNNLKPHHNLFTAFGNKFINKLNLNRLDDRMDKFFKGEQICGDVQDGYCSICVDGFPIGFGKSKNSVINNHYPKGLRS